MVSSMGSSDASGSGGGGEGVLEDLDFDLERDLSFSSFARDLDFDRARDFERDFADLNFDLDRLVGVEAVFLGSVTTITSPSDSTSLAVSIASGSTCSASASTQTGISSSFSLSSFLSIVFRSGLGPAPVELSNDGLLRKPCFLGGLSSSSGVGGAFSPKTALGEGVERLYASLPVCGFGLGGVFKISGDDGSFSLSEL